MGQHYGLRRKAFMTATIEKSGSQGGVMSRQSKVANIVITILLWFGAILMVFPLFYMVMMSFMTKNQILSAYFSIIPHPWVFGKYQEVMQKGEFISGIVNSFSVAIPVLLFGGFTSTLATFAFSHMRFRGKNLIFMILLSAIMMPFAAVMIPQYALFSNLGWTNTLAPLIIPGCFGNIGMIFFLVQNKGAVPNSLVEAAKIDGCGYFRIYWKIFLPLMKGAVATQLILWFMGIWNDYLAPTIFLQNENTWTLQVVINSFNSYYSIQSDYALIMAASVIALAPPIILFFVFQKYIIESIAISGVKG
jgi:multiple sugar transport system permease protein